MKKGNIQVQALSGLFIFIIAAFIIALSFGVWVFIGTTTHNELLKHEDSLQKVLGDSGNATEIINDTVGQFSISLESLKWISVMLIVGYIMNFLIIGYFARLHPIFFIAYIVICIVAIIVSAPIANAYDDFRANEHLDEHFTGFLGLNFIFSNFPTWVTAISILGGIIIFIGFRRHQNIPGAQF